MTRRIALAVLLCGAPGLALLSAPASATEAAPARADADSAYVHLKAPLFSSRFASFPVAQVEDEVISLQELFDALATTHQSHGAPAAKGDAPKRDYSAVLDRLIGVRLCVLEAREMGLDDLPQVKAEVAKFRQSTLVELLKERVSGAVKAGDPKRVDELYKASAREVRVASAVFGSSDEAKKFAEVVTAGKGFDEAAQQLVSEKKAKTFDAGAHFVRVSSLLPPVAEAVQKLSAGGVSAPIHAASAYSVVKLLEVSYGQDAKLRANTERVALSENRSKALQKYRDDLIRKRAHVDEDLLAALDYEKPGAFEKLVKDQRVLARVKGDKPITVGRFSDELAALFYHGTDTPAKQKRVNEKKPELLQQMLSERLIPEDARRLGIDKSDAFKKKMADFEANLLFSLFVEKAILPDIKVEDAQKQKYFDQHKADFTSPAMYKLETLGFTDAKLAQAALEKLRAGTDFKWLTSNADGQVKASDALKFEGSVLAASTLPPELAAAIEGTRSGDYRLCSTTGGTHVVHVVQVFPPTERPFAEVKDEIEQRLRREQLNRAMKEWTEKLRGSRDVKVYITRIGA